MSVAENLIELRRAKGLSQEELAEYLAVSRQAIGKWESGNSLPEVEKLIQLSDFYKVSLDRLIRDKEACNKQFGNENKVNNQKIISFLLKAKKATYAASGNETSSSRTNSHDLEFSEDELHYYDTYLGGERFGGEEAIWIVDKPFWCMNYCGRVIGENFNGDVLKNALANVPADSPYRGPAFFQEGDYTYHCKADGAFEWYQGYEEILYKGNRIYECYFHGGIII